MGLPRQVTVMRWPSWMGERSTSVVACASVSCAGFMLPIKGQIAEAAPTIPTAVAVSVRKSRRVVASPTSWGLAVSAIDGPLLAPADRRRRGKLYGPTGRPHATSCRNGVPEAGGKGAADIADLARRGNSDEA